MADPDKKWKLGEYKLDEEPTTIWIGNDTKLAGRLAVEVRDTIDKLGIRNVEIFSSNNNIQSMAEVMREFNHPLFPAGFGLKGAEAMTDAVNRIRSRNDFNEGRQAVRTLSEITEFAFSNAMEAKTAEQKQWVIDQMVRKANGDRYVDRVRIHQHCSVPEQDRHEIPDEGPWPWNWDAGEGPTKLRFK